MNLTWRILGVGALLTFAAAAVPGQAAMGLQSTPVAPEEPFVLAQANHGRDVTLRLDRYSGAVSRLGSPDGQRVVWIAMAVPGVAKLALPAKLRFQIYTYEGEYTMLFDQATGKAWRLVPTREEAKWIWEAIGG